MCQSNVRYSLTKYITLPRENPMARPLSDRDWKTLLGRIQKGRCTPIIGDGALEQGQPRRSEVALRWAKDHNFPLQDATNLAQVSQYVSVALDDPLVPKEDMIELISNAPPFDPNLPGDIHNTLARLPFPVYITTNYDNAMSLALKAQRKNPHREICRWNHALRDEPSAFDADQGFDPNPAGPVVYHLYGHDGIPESLVMTEDDHLDYLVSISMGNHAVLPPRIRRALAEPSLLFIGYRLDSLSFRVLFRGIIHTMQGLGRTLNLAVQLPPDLEPQVEYLENYFEDFADLRVKIYWGTAQEFAQELSKRWRVFDDE